jgi:hypothetical protein
MPTRALNTSRCKADSAIAKSSSARKPSSSAVVPVFMPRRSSQVSSNNRLTAVAINPRGLN